MQDFQIFSEDGEGRPADMKAMMEWMTHAIEEHEMDPREAVEALVDIVRPGNSENSHDVKPMWAGSMWALGFGHVAEKVHGLYLNTMPWGLAFAISVEQDFQFEALSEGAKRAVIQSLATVINMGGIQATVNADNTIRITLDDGETTDMTTDHIVGQFRREIEAELGPDAPGKGDNPMRRWMP